jgi:serine protease inhibitor
MMADPTPTPTPTPQTADKVLAAIVDFVTKSEVDVQNALTQATAANNNITIPAWTALLAFMKQVAAVSVNVPALHLATDIELVTEVTQALQPGSPLVTAFAALAQYQGQAAASMVTGIVTGALSLTKLIPVLPIIP